MKGKQEMNSKIVAGMKIKDQYGKISEVIWVYRTRVVTDRGSYHITKVFPVK